MQINAYRSRETDVCARYTLWERETIADLKARREHEAPTYCKFRINSHGAERLLSERTVPPSMTCKSGCVISI